MEVITFNIGQSATNNQIVGALGSEVSTNKPAVIFIQQAKKNQLNQNGLLSFDQEYTVHSNQAILIIFL